MSMYVAIQSFMLGVMTGASYHANKVTMVTTLEEHSVSRA